MSEYREELVKAMNMLAEDKRTLFIGQSVAYPGHIMTGTLEGVPKERVLELPVAEELQMGMSIGLALEGYLPVSIFPRMDFLIIATNQLVNHLDKLDDMSKGQFKPKVIIRTMVGSIRPMDPGPQHSQDHTIALRLLLERPDITQILEQSEWETIEDAERPLWAWIAGLIDGEGHIQLLKRKYPRSPHSLRLSINMTDRRTIERIEEITRVGRVYTREKGAKNQMQWLWTCAEREASSVLRRCLPWLVTKRKHALVAIEFSRLRHLNQPGVAASVGVLAKRDELARRMSQLNQGDRAIDVVKLTRPEEILPAYEKALASLRSTILVEAPPRREGYE